MADDIRIDPKAFAEAATTLTRILMDYAGAMCDAQILEGQLVWILMLLRRDSGDFANYSEFAWALRQVRRDSMQKVLDGVKRHGIRIPPGTAKKLEDAFRARNYLAHQFFHDHNPAFPPPTAAHQALRAIADRGALIKRATEILNPLYTKLANAIGYSIEDPRRREAFLQRTLRQIDEYASRSESDSSADD